MLDSRKMRSEESPLMPSNNAPRRGKIKFLIYRAQKWRILLRKPFLKAHKKEPLLKLKR